MEQSAANQLWHELQTGSWSVIDQVDRDQRRFLLARENAPPTRDARAMTARERQVVEYASLGNSNKVIAYELGISASTVSTHLSHAAAKLGLRSRSAIIQTYAALAVGPPTDVSVSYTREAGENFAVLSLPMGRSLPATLTPAEREVTTLVFAGLSNSWC